MTTTGLTTLQLCPQQVAEEVVVPVPLPVPVEGDEQEVRVGERFQDRAGARTVEHRVAELPAHSIEHGCSRQEGDLGIREALEQFGAQIVRHQPVVARERNAGVLPRAAGLQGERREVKPNWPSFGAIEQRVDLGVGELHAGSIEQRAPFGPRHRQIVDADLDDLTAGA